MIPVLKNVNLSQVRIPVATVTDPRPSTPRPAPPRSRSPWGDAKPPRRRRHYRPRHVQEMGCYRQRVPGVPAPATLVAVAAQHSTSPHVSRASTRCAGSARLPGHGTAPPPQVGELRVRVEIMGPVTYEHVGESQPVLNYDQSHDLHPHPCSGLGELHASHHHGEIHVVHGSRFRSRSPGVPPAPSMELEGEVPSERIEATACRASGAGMPSLTRRPAASAAGTRATSSNTWPRPNGCLIEAPWMVNGGHGASLRQPQEGRDRAPPL
jgi:hypothetical protein